MKFPVLYTDRVNGRGRTDGRTAVIFPAATVDWPIAFSVFV